MMRKYKYLTWLVFLFPFILALLISMPEAIKEGRHFWSVLFEPIIIGLLFSFPASAIGLIISLFYFVDALGESSKKSFFTFLIAWICCLMASLVNAFYVASHIHFVGL